ncbi:hypothetical protein [Aquimarina sp. AD10]|uniref:hypothetical protein n=1 Tax=Aquimarina sp. AD10 TaxID=1714849 RepID=UPI0011C42A26|nr:hypothetical protein [Aquimarina sp. AD10]
MKKTTLVSTLFLLSLSIKLIGQLNVPENAIRFSEARGFDYDPTKDAVYFNDYNNGRVISFGIGGNIELNGNLTTKGNKIRFSEARGFDYDPTNDALYFNDYNNGRVISFGIGGNIELNGNLTTKGNKIRFSEARGFDYDPADDAVYFNDYNNGRVISFGIGGNIGMRGKLTCSEVKVQIGGGADFVFANDYNLPTLEYVESFIKEYNHLPEIAPANEMEKDGIYLAKMNIQLLQKIEELTLYTIQQQKEIEELKLQNKKFLELQSRLEKLESEK